MDYAALAIVLVLIGFVCSMGVLYDLFRTEMRKAREGLEDVVRRETMTVARKVDELADLTDGCKTLAEHAIHVAVSAEHHADDAALRAHRVGSRAEQAAERAEKAAAVARVLVAFPMAADATGRRGRKGEG